MSEILHDDFISLAAGAKLVPSWRNGASTNPATLFRWIRDGVMLPGGERLHLRATRTGGKWSTRVEWLEEFLATLTAAHTPGAAPPETRPPSRREAERRSRKAGRKLQELGA
jgi:hypothetical protein